MESLVRTKENDEDVVALLTRVECHPYPILLTIHLVSSNDKMYRQKEG